MLLIGEATHQNDVWLVMILAGESNHFARGLPRLDHGQPESHLRQLLLQRISKTEHHQCYAISHLQELLVCDVVLPHPREVPNAEMAGVWDGDLLYGHAVGTFEDRLSESGGRTLSKETAQETALDGVDELCLSDAGCSTHQELYSVQRHLA